MTYQEIINKTREKLEQRRDRSAWDKGVNAYALDLLDDLEEYASGGYITAETFATSAALKAAALNGADDWSAYSWGGSALIYDGEIAERLCTPSELKKTRGGERRPNAREEWLDTQARALCQAFRRLWSAVAAVEIKEKEAGRI